MLDHARHAAATRLQAAQRRSSQQRIFAEQRAAATKLQASQRGRAAKSSFSAQRQAATRVQAVERGRVARLADGAVASSREAASSASKAVKRMTAAVGGLCDSAPEPAKGFVSKYSVGKGWSKIFGANWQQRYLVLEPLSAAGEGGEDGDTSAWRLAYFEGSSEVTGPFNERGSLTLPSGAEGTVAAGMPAQWDEKRQRAAVAAMNRSLDEAHLFTISYSVNGGVPRQLLCAAETEAEQKRWLVAIARAARQPNRSRLDRMMPSSKKPRSPSR